MINLPKSVTEARSRMLIKAIFFATVLYERGDLRLTDENGMWRGMPVQTACCDGRHIVINPAFFAGLTIDERLFVLCHEVYHAMAMHPKRMMYYARHGLCGEDFYPELYNIAADAVINKCLIESSIGKMPDKGVLLKPDDLGGYEVTGMEMPELIYEKLLQNLPRQGKGKKKGQGQGDCQGDDGSGQSPGDDNGDGGGGSPDASGIEQGPMGGDIVEPDTTTAAQINEAEMRTTIASAAAAAKARGQMPGALKSFVDEFLDPQVPWAEKLRQSITTRAGNDRYNWQRPNKRRLVAPGIYVPRMTGIRCGDVICAIDTSGSVSDKELQQYLGELSQILSEVRPDSLTIIWCDAQVDRVDEVDSPEELAELVRADGVGGRGGTSFLPPFQHVADNHMPCDMFIYLTDGYAPFPDEDMAPFPTIWVISSEVVAPWGETIELKI